MQTARPSNCKAVEQYLDRVRKPGFERLPEPDRPERHELDRSEQTGRLERPVRCIERLIANIDEVDLMHDLPVDVTLVHVTDPVGRNVCHLDLEHIAFRLQFAIEQNLERQTPGRRDGATVEPDSGTVANITEFEPPGRGNGRRRIEADRISGRAGEAAGILVPAFGSRAVVKPSGSVGPPAINSTSQLPSIGMGSAAASNQVQSGPTGASLE